MVDGEPDNKNKAAILARDVVGDYGAISYFGEDLRTKVLPFYSWMEINLERYSRFFRNSWSQGIGKGGITSAYITAALGARMMVVYTLVQLYNNMFHPDEEDELDTIDRIKLHVNLGRNDDGEIVLLKTQGALSDALGWIGFDNAMAAIGGIESGMVTWTDIAGEIVKAPVNKVASGLTPLIKTPIELFSGVSWYPDIFHPRPIRDKARESFKLFGLENEYDYLLNKPSRGYDKSLNNLLVYERDVGEINYYRIKKKAADFNKVTKGIEGFSTYLTPRSQALRYYKMSQRFGDKEAEARYRAELVELYGSEAEFRKGLKRSIKKAHPLGSVAIGDRADFMSRLTPKEKDALMKAVDWYEDVFLDAY